MLTQAELKEVIFYDIDTGMFHWIKPSTKNNPAGTIDKSTGYRRVFIKNKNYYVHRLAWLYITGEWPKYQIDHKNEIKSDNRWINLRQATKSENMQNISSANKDSTTGIRGVGWSNRYKIFTAQIHVNGKKIFLGNFKDKLEAKAAYLQAKKTYHKFKLVD